MVDKKLMKIVGGTIAAMFGIALISKLLKPKPPAPTPPPAKEVKAEIVELLVE